MGIIERIQYYIKQKQDERTIQETLEEAEQAGWLSDSIERKLREMNFDENKVAIYNKLKEIGKFDGFYRDSYYDKNMGFEPHFLLMRLKIKDIDTNLSMMNELLDIVREKTKILPSEAIAWECSVGPEQMATLFMERLEGKQVKLEFLKKNFNDVDLKEIKKFFEDLSEEEIRSVINETDIEDMDKAYYVQARLKDSTIREKYDEKISYVLQSTSSDFYVEEEGEYLKDTLHRYRDTMSLNVLSGYLEKCKRYGYDGYIQESKDSMYRYEKEGSEVLDKRLLEMCTSYWGKSALVAVDNFIIDSYTDCMNDKIYKFGDTILEDMLKHIKTNMRKDNEKEGQASDSERIEVVNALVDRYAKNVKQKGQKVKDVGFMKYLTYEDGIRFFSEYNDIIERPEEVQQVLYMNFIKKLSDKSEEERVEILGDSHLPIEIAKEVIVDYIKNPENKFKMAKAYIDSMSSKDIDDIRRSITRQEEVDNLDSVEKIEVLIHVKREQEKNGNIATAGEQSEKSIKNTVPNAECPEY